MGDAAGELAGGPPFFGPPNPVLRGDLVGESAQESVQDKALSRFHRGGAQLGPELSSIAPPRHDFAAASENLVSSGAQKARQTCSQTIAICFPNKQFDEVFPECVLARPPENRFRLRIPVQDAAAFVDLDEGIERGIDDAACLSFAFAQCFLGQPAFGNVTAAEKIPLDRFGPCSKPGQRYDPPIFMDAVRIGNLGPLSAPQG